MGQIYLHIFAYFDMLNITVQLCRSGSPQKSKRPPQSDWVSGGLWRRRLKSSIDLHSMPLVMRSRGCSYNSSPPGFSSTETQHSIHLREASFSGCSTETRHPNPADIGHSMFPSLLWLQVGYSRTPPPR